MEARKAANQECANVFESMGTRRLWQRNLQDLFVLHWQCLQRRYVWIDQICIDQENKCEKSQQIRLTSEIYRCAAGMIIWLE